MAKPRAHWKGYLQIGELSCPIALYSAATTSERTSFRTVNKATGHGVNRVYVDAETGKPVERDDQVKGYETDQGRFVVLEQEEIDAVVPVSDKTLSVENFIPCRDVDTVFFDKPYYLAPDGKPAEKAFGLIREGLKAKKVAALAEAVLFRRVRKLMIRAYDEGLVANTLNFDYEVRSADQAFDDIPSIKISKEMIDLAKHIIKTKAGKFNPEDFDDRYENAVAEMVRAKLEGKPLPKAKPDKERKVISLLDALRESAGGARKSSAKKSATKSTRAKKAGAAKRLKKAS